MEKEYVLNGFIIKVNMEEGIVRIGNDTQLWGMLNNNRLVNSRLLVQQIADDYAACFGKPLEISAESLIVEIWGHVYIDYFSRSLNDWLKLQPVAALAEKIAGYCSVIDCGESGKDSNRFVWDMLSGQVTTIDKLLPGQIDTETLK